MCERDWKKICVCEGERERERESAKKRALKYQNIADRMEGESMRIVLIDLCMIPQMSV